MTLRFKQPRVKEPAYLDLIRQLPCIVCGDNTTTEAAHIRYADRTVGKRMTGMAEKPDDKYALPVCGECHREQHSTNECEWWVRKRIDPVKSALALYVHRNDPEMCLVICANARLTGDIRTQSTTFNSR